AGGELLLATGRIAVAAVGFDEEGQPSWRLLVRDDVPPGRYAVEVLAIGPSRELLGARWDVARSDVVVLAGCAIHWLVVGGLIFASASLLVAAVACLALVP